MTELGSRKYRDLSVARKSIICLCLRHWQIIDLLAPDKSRYFEQPRPMIDSYVLAIHACAVELHRNKTERSANM